ncbi:hypothetical protein AALO_G00060620 [Alosa alosa]|uniref:DNA-directed RNA polymerase III subunit RPC4 n=1 Tax=Alosa alosa TaxID=278164 RepID=A0AAV6H404_9TELE|nr:DNA-directed RNA polymerase III subunit RPC4 isoform X1 [Alosa alosa]KAG5280491.1 hypothetical protein AALO_G00060620 [Alosa alosa]
MAAPNARDSKTPTVSLDGAGKSVPMGRRLPASLSPGRLPSMRSRDLTLGGVKKKTFTPNIIGRKVKEEQKTDGGHRRDKKDFDRGRQRDGRGRGRGRPEVIQSHSIFEQGPAEMMAKRRTVFDDARETPNSAPCPIINIKKEKRETEEETKEILRKLEKDNFLDDPHLKNDAKSCPVQLPLSVSGWVFKEEFNEDIAEDVRKHESSEEDSTNPSTETSPLIKIKQEPDLPETKKLKPTFRPPPIPQPDVLSKLLESCNQLKGVELFFMQLPDSLPGQPPTTDKTRQAKTEVQSECGQSVLQKSESQEPEEDGSCNLRDLQEGLVGRVLVRKSGRVQFVLGNVTLDVDLGTTSSFLQELVSVGIEGRSGTMSVLGHIKHKLVCSPDFQTLLENQA